MQSNMTLCESRDLLKLIFLEIRLVRGSWSVLWDDLKEDLKAAPCRIHPFISHTSMCGSPQKPPLGEGLRVQMVISS